MFQGCLRPFKAPGQSVLAALGNLGALGMLGISGQTLYIKNYQCFWTFPLVPEGLWGSRPVCTFVALSWTKLGIAGH